MTGRTVMVCLLAITGTTHRARAAHPWADAVVSYSPGSTAVPDFLNAAVAVGPPERFTGETDFGGAFPSAVSIFSPPFGTDEIVSIGEGGHLTVRFAQPVLDLPGNLYGIDLILFSNSGFVDFNYPSGQQGSPPALFGSVFGAARVEVSADGLQFFPVTVRADRLFPTQGFLDSGPYDVTPGSVPTNFLRPVNPALTAADFSGLTYAQSLALYDGSGGGLPIDLATAGLGSISYLRVSVDDDGSPGTSRHVEIDAFAAVPEPLSGGLLVFGWVLSRCFSGALKGKKRAG